MSGKKALISGIGITDIGRRTATAALDLTERAAREAIADAGLEVDAIDGIATMGETPVEDACARLGIDPAYRGGGYDRGGLLTHVMAAAEAVEAGVARHVLIYRTVKMMDGSLLSNSGEAKGVAVPPRQSLEEARLPSMMADFPQLLAYHGFAATNWLGMHCQRHMHLYGTTREQLGWLAINSRRNAALNPRAIFQEPITMDDYLAAPMISTPFGRLDCDVPIDGSAAFVVSHPDHLGEAKEHALAIEAFGGSTGPGAWTMRPDYPAMASVDAAAEMWSKTKLGPADVDMAQLYDGFTFLTFAWLEALGLCAKGGAGPFVEGAQRIAIDGELPLNTYGGQLSAGRLHGYWGLHEACLQMRRNAGTRQVRKDLNVAVVSNGGGPIAGCLLLTRG